MKAMNKKRERRNLEIKQAVDGFFKNGPNQRQAKRFVDAKRVIHLAISIRREEAIKKAKIAAAAFMAQGKRTLLLMEKFNRYKTFSKPPPKLTHFSKRNSQKI